jgi:hypothetical protein
MRHVLLACIIMYIGISIVLYCQLWIFDMAFVRNYTNSIHEIVFKSTTIWQYPFVINHGDIRYDAIGRTS